MGAPGHCRASKTGAMASSKEKSTATILHAQAFTRHPRLTMQTPTTAQLRTAIEVLKKLGERIDKGLLKNKFRFCWRLFGCLARRERRAYPSWVCKERATTPDSQTAPALRGGAAPGHLLRCSSVTAHWRGCSLLAPRIWRGGAPAKIGSYF